MTQAAKKSPAKAPLNGRLPQTFAEAADLLPTMNGGRNVGATPDQIDAARAIVYGERS